MRVPPLTGASPTEMAQAVRELADGGTNALGSFTLDDGATETEVADPNVTVTSRISPVPTSASAAASGWWVKSVGEGSFKIGHASSAATDMTFWYERRR